MERGGVSILATLRGRPLPSTLNSTRRAAKAGAEVHRTATRAQWPELKHALLWRLLGVDVVLGKRLGRPDLLGSTFQLQSSYNVLYAQDGGGDAQYRAFDDTWTWDEAAADRLASLTGASARATHHVTVGFERILGPSGMLAHLTYMAERLEHMCRLLKPNGSLHFHCDPTAAHYLKVLLDAVFGGDGFRNEIQWRRYGTHNVSRRSSRALCQCQSEFHLGSPPALGATGVPPRQRFAPWRSGHSRVVRVASYY